jgi:hypothetical protein
VLLCFRLPEQLAKKPTIDELSAKLEVLQAEHDSLKEFLKKSFEKETKEKKEREKNMLRTSWIWATS